MHVAPQPHIQQHHLDAADANLERLDHVVALRQLRQIDRGKRQHAVQRQRRPPVDQGQLDQDEGYLRLGRDEGAELVGGARVRRATDGYFLAPALFLGASNAMRISREEIFGPVAAVIKVKDYDEALSVANDTEFGLSAGICTTSLKYATHFKRNAEAGMVMVNLPTAGVDFHVPFGGAKGSSFGAREQGRYAAEFYTTVKTAYTAA